jgi:hypothetical protein
LNETPLQRFDDTTIVDTLSTECFCFENANILRDSLIVFFPPFLANDTPNEDKETTIRIVSTSCIEWSDFGAISQYHHHCNARHRVVFHFTRHAQVQSRQREHHLNRRTVLYPMGRL